MRVFAIICAVLAAIVAGVDVWLGALLIEDFGDPVDGSGIVFVFWWAMLGLAAALGARRLLAGGAWRRIATWSLWTYPPFLLLLLASST